MNKITNILFLLLFFITFCSEKIKDNKELGLAFVAEMRDAIENDDLLKIRNRHTLSSLNQDDNNKMNRCLQITSGINGIKNTEKIVVAKIDSSYKEIIDKFSFNGQML